ncbi:MAG TPA: DUF542 domain-containing protein [Gemmatimonadales bacterium]|nr:DUF542 domain-containing protein [Gemmatimonadales bacterium]
MSLTTDAALVLDVRPILAAGAEPLELILATARDVERDRSFDLIAPFDPQPLYPVLRACGFRAERSTEPDGSTRVKFIQTGITPESTLRDVAAAGEGHARVLGAHGMDSCCSGPKTLAFAAQAHGLQLDALLAELQEIRER